ncbi:hypothetical protein H696_00814 [Fonticula alba]|uniref:Probable metalloprotease ARX1 n=1 Tax=Fonticula alba TaxID=691883 RepID=A0A058ZIC6_FONAL|nr:hypothetical protein H696_00814 [Fonticula alba]KCV73272.1 hypothetical protein H696_00814 [Fonticula alba]|eukprot:XP_009492973.1 hypothetical protein H696_00814 [Fonticula alba]
MSRGRRQLEREFQSECFEDIEDTIVNPDVRNFYQIAASIANGALAAVVDACQPGASVLDLCILGDRHILESQGTIPRHYRQFRHGVAFPTSVAVNNIIGNCCPLKTDPPMFINPGDIVKIELGVHFNTFPVMAGTTVHVPPGDGADSPVADFPRLADLLSATHYASLAALQLLRPGHRCADLRAAISQVAAHFRCNVIPGILSTSLHRELVEGHKSFSLGAKDGRHPRDGITFEEGEVYAVSILLSTGTGSCRLASQAAHPALSRPNIYARQPLGFSTQLRLRASRTLLNQITEHHSVFPFSVRSLGDEAAIRLGLADLASKDMVTPYPTFVEAPTETVAMAKFTVLLTHEGPLPVAFAPVDDRTHLIQPLDGLRELACFEALVAGARRLPALSTKGQVDLPDRLTRRFRTMGLGSRGPAGRRAQLEAVYSASSSEDDELGVAGGGQ